MQDFLLIKKKHIFQNRVKHLTKEEEENEGFKKISWIWETIFLKFGKPLLC